MAWWIRSLTPQDEATRPADGRCSSDSGSDATLEEFFRLCHRGGPNCAFSAGDPRKRYDRLTQRLLARPAQLPDSKGATAAFTYADLVALTTRALYRPATWAPLATFLDTLDTAPSSRAAAVALRTLLTQLRPKVSLDAEG